MNVKLWLAHLGRWLGYTAFFFVMSMLFMVLTFPEEDAAQYISAKASSALAWLRAKASRAST